MAQHAESHGGGQEHDGSHGISQYLYVFVALCVLTGASAFTYTDFWRQRMPVHVGWTFMMAVSCCKAALVIWFFMHVKYEASWKWVLTIPPAIMSVFLMLALVPDIGLRDAHVSGERRLHMATERQVDSHGRTIEPPPAAPAQ